MTSSFISLLTGLFVVCSCNNEANSKKNAEDNTQTTIQDTTPVTKPANDQTDEQGCKTADGEQWSMIKKACIRLADNIKIDAKDASLDPAKPAWLAFSDDRVRVEIFLPTQKKSVVIRKVSAAGEPEKWANGPLTVTFKDGMYSLDDEGKLLYQGAAK